MEALLGSNVINGSKGKVELATFCGAGKCVGIYFSAHWCPPCRGFTPVLSDWYKQFKAGPNGGDLEIVFASSDRDQAAFDEYFGEMPWLAIDYKERETKNALSGKFGVSGIPTLIFLDGEGNVIDADGRSWVMKNQGLPKKK